MELARLSIDNEHKRAYNRGVIKRKGIAMTTRIITTKQVKDLVKQFREMGYTIDKQENAPYKPRYVVTGSQGEVFRALPNAVGSTYLARFETGLISERAL